MASDRRMNISIFGLGYVGAVSAACLCERGHTVIGVDTNATKVAMINDGKAPVIEPNLFELIASAVENKSLTATTDAAQAIAQTDISIICVGTPSQPNGSLDIQYLIHVCEEIGAALRSKSQFHTVVIRSTILPGTMRGVLIPLLEKASGKHTGIDFGVCNNPEFLREGTAIFDFMNPPKTVIGETDSKAGDMLQALYDGLPAPIFRCPIATAEMVKYADNTWHATKVAFANEIGTICKAGGIDSHRVMEIFCADTKLNLSSYYLKPGFAFGGSCLPKDVRALNHYASASDLDTPLLKSLLPANRAQLERGIAMILATGKKRIGILGFSFKAGTDDLRESPLVEVIERLIGKGCEVRLYDSNVQLAKLMGANRDYIFNVIPHIERLMVSNIAHVLEHAEILVIGNASPEFAAIANRLHPEQIVIDLVRIASIENAHEQYHGIGW